MVKDSFEETVIERNKTMPVQQMYYFIVTKLLLTFMKDFFIKDFIFKYIKT